MARAVGLKPERAPDSFRGLVKTQMVRPSFQSPEGLEKDPRISISNKFPGEAVTTGLEVQPENHWARDVGRAPTQLVQTGYLGEINYLGLGRAYRWKKLEYHPKSCLLDIKIILS